MRITKDYDHHPKCDEDCEKLYCPEHRLIFFWCQSATYQSAAECRGLWDGGECPECKADARHKAAIRALENMENRLRAVLNEGRSLWLKL